MSLKLTQRQISIVYKVKEKGNDFFSLAMQIVYNITKRQQNTIGVPLLE